MTETTDERPEWWQVSTAERTRLDLMISTDGLCALGERDPELWFPAERDEGPRSARGKAKSMDRAERACASETFGACPVQGACALLALNRRDQYGIWAGVPGWAWKKAIKADSAVEELLSGLRDDAGVIARQRAQFEAGQAEAREDGPLVAA